MIGLPGSLDVVIVKRPPASTVRRLPTDPVAAAPVTVLVSGCHVEVQRQTEDIGLTALNTEVAWFFLPVTSDTRAIQSTDALRFGGRDYQMQGPASLEFTLDGDAVQVWCVGRWEAS